MNKETLIAAITALPDVEFEHVAHVCHDIAKRLPDSKGFGKLGTAARSFLGIPEPVIEPISEPADQTSTDVVVGLTGNVADSAVGGL